MTQKIRHSYGSDGWQSLQDRLASGKFKPRPDSFQLCDLLTVTCITDGQICYKFPPSLDSCYCV